jgi:hypothetical protein
MSPQAREALREVDSANANCAVVLEQVFNGTATATQIAEAVSRARAARGRFLYVSATAIGKPKGLMREEPFTRDLW